MIPSKRKVRKTLARTDVQVGGGLLMALLTAFALGWWWYRRQHEARDRNAPFWRR